MAQGARQISPNTSIDSEHRSQPATLFLMANTAARVVIVASIWGVGTPVSADKHVMHRRFPQSATMMSRRSLASDSCDGIVSRFG